jgi:Adenylate and Guanylate cyclase catalytic domain
VWLFLDCIVLANSFLFCSNPTFSYRVDGDRALYLGRGDHHDPKFDGMAVSSMLKDLGEFSLSRSSYTGVPLNEDYCPFTFCAYPSATMEAQYVTTNPIFFTVGVVAIFCFTSLVFATFDWTVERRQRKVMSTAVRTDAIVNSLFPSVVRERIFPTEVSSKASERKNAFKLPNMMSRGKDAPALDDLRRSAIVATPGASPVAEMYPETTVFFADIAGFTSWSSERSPVAVFTLLETIYSEFDAIARKRRVFKVETIGDCYVAVGGLPEPMKDHAVTMCRFARDCRIKVNELTNNLESTLGPGTADLRLRIGLHSGAVTAGVLRGERSRFQVSLAGHARHS